MPPADRHARTDRQESPDKIEPTLAAEPIEKAEATEPTEPTERIEPAEPMDRIEPAEPMDKIEPLDPMLRSEPAEPLGRGEPSVFCMTRSSQLCRSAASGVRRVRDRWGWLWASVAGGRLYLPPFHDCGDKVAHQVLRCTAIIYPGHGCAANKLPVVPFLAQFIIFGHQDQ